MLVAHSAGGWIARIWLGSADGRAEYGKRAYAAAARVTALLTMGTPHSSIDGITRRNLGFVNSQCPGCLHHPAVAYVAVASDAVAGRRRGEAAPPLGRESSVASESASPPTEAEADFACTSYELTCGRGDVRGDGVVPASLALNLPSPPCVHVMLPHSLGVRHGPPPQQAQASPAWYGSPAAVDVWLPRLEEALSQ